MSDPRSIHALLDGPATLSVEEAGEYLGISRSAAYRLVTAGVIPATQISKSRYIVSAVRLAAFLGADTKAHIQETMSRVPTAEEIDRAWEFYREDEDAQEEAAAT